MNLEKAGMRLVQPSTTACVGKDLTIRLVSDGCSGQNKNTTMLGMCTQWLSEKAPQNAKIKLVFPVPEHSFLPSDRVFGNIEKKIGKLEDLEYYNFVIPTELPNDTPDQNSHPD